jgi:glycosyltransferase involved in cell wall biosynthesis
LQGNAFLFVLPDEVGGTHPALVEAMGFGNCVLVNDTPSNLEVIGDAGFSYCGQEEDRDLSRRLQFLLDRPETVSGYRSKAGQRARAKYSWDQVVSDHLVFYRQVLGAEAMPVADGIDSARNWGD